MSSSESTFPTATVDAVLAHMNSDHTDDNLLIVRAFAAPDATSATMTTLDHRGGTWTYALAGSDHELTLPWTAEISERPEIRREIVALYDSACAALGIEAREH
ncbi:MAG: DUF2470 domain-containing protein [Rhodoglobus sp.]